MTPAYLDYFGVADAPFSIAPDPRYLFMSLKHREALAHLLYGVNSDAGFVVLTGEVGTGKTTVCRYLLEQLPSHCEVALIFNPKLSALELLASICEEFHIDVPDPEPGVKAYIDRLNGRLLNLHARGRTAVLIIDEAQSLGADVLEQVRLLTNLETNRRKLLRILLLGQPQLRATLERPDMAQLAQRIVARHHLEPLSRTDMMAYVMHRMAVAGAREDLFSRAALKRLYRLSGGVPRLVNLIADRALLGTYVKGREEVDGATMLQAGREVLGEQTVRQQRPQRAAAIGLGALGILAATAAAYLRYELPHTGLRSDSPVSMASGFPGLSVASAAVPSAGEPGTFSLEAADPVEKELRAAAEGPAVSAPQELLRLGSQGPAVQRLRQDLGLIRGIPDILPASQVFDADLEREIQNFQQAHGLLVDGRVGPETWLSLGQALERIQGRPGKEE